MNKKNLAVIVLVLVVAASLGAAIYFHGLPGRTGAPPGGELPAATGPTPPGSTAAGAENTGGGPGPSSSKPQSGPAGAQDPAGKNQQGPANVTQQDPAQGAGQDTAKGALQAQIEQKYTGRLQATGSSYEARLNSLVASAFNDYREAGKANPNADISALADRYYAAGKALEAECDARMYAILDAFENELRANSLPIDAALRARADYEATKSERAGQLLSIKP